MFENQSYFQTLILIRNYLLWGYLQKWD